MPKSRKRGGKKAHNKRVKNRNKKIQDKVNRYNKYQQEVFDEMMKNYEKQLEKGAENMPDIDQVDGVDGPEV